MANSNLQNELKRAKYSVNPKYVTITPLEHPEQLGMGMILQVDVKGIRSRGAFDLTKEPFAVGSYRFFVNIPENAYSHDSPTPVTVKFDGVIPFSLHSFPSGSFCYGPKLPVPPLHVIIKKTLLGCVFAPELMNVKDRANSDVVAWTEAHKHEFPYFPPELLFNGVVESAQTIAATFRPTVRRG